MSGKAAAFALALIIALPIANDLLHMPVQVADALDEIIDSQSSPSWIASYKGALEDRAHVRPLRVAQSKMLFDLAHGHYQTAYRGFHAALLILLILLFVHALRVRTTSDVAVALFGLVVLTGFHTFEGTVREAYPVNHFLEIAVCCLIAFNLTLSRPAWWIDLIAIVTCVVAMLTLESGILVWVVVAAAWLCGLRGISGRSTAVMTGLVVLYLIWFSVHRGDNLPLFDGRPSGYLFSVLENDELVRRFGDHPWVFYIYNVTVSIASILFGQPQDGWLGKPETWFTPRPYLSLISNTVTTALIVWVAVRLGRSGAWRRGDLAPRLFVIVGAVIIANAFVSHAYTKDDTISTAAVFYAIAACVAVRQVIDVIDVRTRAFAVVVTAALLITSVTFTVQAAGVHHLLTGHAFRTRNDWARLPGLWMRQGRWPADDAARRLILQLRREALTMPVSSPGLAPAWTISVWGD